VVSLSSTPGTEVPILCSSVLFAPITFPFSINGLWLSLTWQGRTYKVIKPHFPCGPQLTMTPPFLCPPQVKQRSRLTSPYDRPWCKTEFFLLDQSRPERFIIFFYADNTGHISTFGLSRQPRPSCSPTFALLRFLSQSCVALSRVPSTSMFFSPFFREKRFFCLSGFRSPS